MELVKAALLPRAPRYDWGCTEIEVQVEDIAYIAIAIAFFVIAAAYVRGLDRIVRGRGEEEEQPVSAE
jgi:hypothetical protein